jgi:hypothetical protein
MKCPHCGKHINPAAMLGSAGGKTKGATKARDPEKMRAAALKRWAAVKK